MPESGDSSDDDKVKSGKMPFGSNIHTAARNNYFNSKIKPSLANKKIEQDQPSWQQIDKKE